jgi:CHAT domain-containing protein/tetratricopeptide (TPR) repeat protein
MQENNTWILEITCQGSNLSMSLYEKEQTSPVKAISTQPLDFSKIERLNNEIVAVINKANRRRILDGNSIAELKKNARLFYDFLLTKQVKNKLSSLDSVNLVLSLDERLINIPWELLFDGNNFLCLKFNLGRSIRTQNIPTQSKYRSIPAKPRMLILANPTGDLRSAYQEGLYIKNRLTRKRNISIDFKAQDIDSNYVRKNIRDYDIIHFAGHCEYYSRSTEESGWIFSDGRVSVKDFLTLGESSSLPSIIFTNACQSACITDNLMDEQAQSKVYGLAQALIFAGVRHYLGSFWRIEDDFSREFADEFYNQIISAQSIGQAVRLARLELLRQHGISAIAWAGYVLYGDPSFVLFPSTPLVTRVAGDKFKVHLPVISRKKIAMLGLSLGIILLSSAMIKILPTINPNTYRIFLRAERLYNQGNNPEVISLLSQIVQQNPLYLPAWKLRGDVNFRLGKFSNALKDYFDYARFSERKKDYNNLATAYIKIAWTYHMWGDYKKSEEFYQKALELSQRYQDKLNEADAMARLAVWHIDKGNGEDAFSLLMKSSEINRQRSHNPEHRFNLACDYFNVAFLYTDKDDLSAAKEFFDKSKEIFKSLGAIPELSDYYFDMGEIALFEKNYDLALEFYHKGLDLDKKLGHQFNLSSDYWMLGEYYWEIGKLTKAEDYFNKAVFICRQINNRPVLAGVYYDLGLMYKEMGKNHKAKEYLAAALKFYKDIDTPDYQEVQQEYAAIE